MFYCFTSAPSNRKITSSSLWNWMMIFLLGFSFSTTSRSPDLTPILSINLLLNRSIPPELTLISAITAIIGALVFLSLSPYIQDYAIYLLPFAAGEFIYIAGSDLVPELHKETNPSKSTLQLIAFIFGLAMLFLLILLE